MESQPRNPEFRNNPENFHQWFHLQLSSSVWPFVFCLRPVGVHSGPSRSIAPPSILSLSSSKADPEATTPKSEPPGTMIWSSLDTCNPLTLPESTFIPSEFVSPIAINSSSSLETSEKQSTLISSKLFSPIVFNSSCSFVLTLGTGPSPTPSASRPGLWLPVDWLSWVAEIKKKLS